MKKIISIFLILFIIFSFCGVSEEIEKEEKAPVKIAEIVEEKNEPAPAKENKSTPMEEKKEDTQEKVVEETKKEPVAEKSTNDDNVDEKKQEQEEPSQEKKENVPDEEVKENNEEIEEKEEKQEKAEENNEEEEKQEEDKEQEGEENEEENNNEEEDNEKEEEEEEENNEEKEEEEEEEENLPSSWTVTYTVSIYLEGQKLSWTGFSNTDTWTAPSNHFINSTLSTRGICEIVRTTVNGEDYPVQEYAKVQAENYIGVSNIDVCFYYRYTDLNHEYSFTVLHQFEDEREITNTYYFKPGDFFSFSAYTSATRPYVRLSTRPDVIWALGWTVVYGGQHNSVIGTLPQNGTYTISGNMIHENVDIEFHYFSIPYNPQPSNPPEPTPTPTPAPEIKKVGKVIIQYRDIETGKNLLKRKTIKKDFGTTITIKVPKIKNYTAQQKSYKYKIHKDKAIITLYYIKKKSDITIIDIENYGTPLGGIPVVTQGGDCLE